MGFPGGSDGKEFAYKGGYQGSIPGLGRSLGEGNGNPVQCPCKENSMDRGAWWATVSVVTKSRTQLSDSHTHTLLHLSILHVHIYIKSVFKVGSISNITA